MNLDPSLMTAIIGNLLVVGVAWGALHQRVRSLEGEMAGLKDLDSRMARVETRIDGLYEQMKELNASIRWMRPPAETYRPPGRRVTEKDDGR